MMDHLAHEFETHTEPGYLLLSGQTNKVMLNPCFELTYDQHGTYELFDTSINSYWTIPLRVKMNAWEESIIFGNADLASEAAVWISNKVRREHNRLNAKRPEAKKFNLL